MKMDDQIPSVSKNEFAYFRRWILIQFLHQFKGKADNKYLFDELNTEEELSGLLNLALKALKGLLKVHVHRPPAVTLNKTPEEFHISTGLR